MKYQLIASHAGAFLFGILTVILLFATGVFDRLWSSPEDVWGKFVPNEPAVRIADTEREMVLLEDFAYIDPRKKVWTAKKGDVVNGASIPRVFWSIVGAPWEGKYRRASILHDVAWVEKSESSDHVHYMFYEACRCGGVPEHEAKTLYVAVLSGGGYWEVAEVESTTAVKVPTAGTKSPTHLVFPKQILKFEPSNFKPAKESPSKDVAEKLKRYIETHNPTIDELKKLDPRRL